MSTTSYNAIVELDQATPPEELLTTLSDYSPVLAASGWRTIHVILTVPAANLTQATTTAVAVVAAASRRPVRSVQTMTTVDFDHRWPLMPTPADDTVSVVEVAELLGITRQAVLKKINAGEIPAERVGHAYRIPRSAVGTPEAGPRTTTTKESA